MKRPTINNQITSEPSYIDTKSMQVDYQKYANDLEKYIDFLEANFKPVNYVRTDKLGNVYKVKNAGACIECKYSKVESTTQCDYCKKNNSIIEYYK